MPRQTLGTSQAPIYGMATFGDLFTRRQLAMLLTLCKLAREAHAEMLAEGIEPERAKAIATYLGLLIDRMADYHSTLCHWDQPARRRHSTYRPAGAADDVGLLRGESFRRLVG